MKIVRIISIKLLLSLFVFLNTIDAYCADDPKYKIKVVFVDFHNDSLELSVNGKIEFSGKVSVEKFNETTGLSMIKYVVFKECNSVHLESKELTFEKNICLNEKTKLLYISGKTRPYFWLSESSTVELD